MDDDRDCVLHALTSKTDIVGKLMVSDPDAARRELGHVRHLIKTMTTLFRSDHPPQNASLATELEVAQQHLEAAGASVRISHDGVPAPSIDGAVRLVLRDAVASILSHAEATAVSILVTDAGISIGSDNGSAPFRRGLAGIRRDVTAQGDQSMTARHRDTVVTTVSFVGDHSDEATDRVPRVDGDGADWPDTSQPSPGGVDHGLTGTGGRAADRTAGLDR